MNDLLNDLNRQLANSKKLSKTHAGSIICTDLLNHVAGGTMADGKPWYLNDGKGGTGFLEKSPKLEVDMPDL